MINLRETIQKSLALVCKVMAMLKKVSCCLDIKSTVREWIDSILEMFEFMYLR